MAVLSFSSAIQPSLPAPFARRPPPASPRQVDCIQYTGECRCAAARWWRAAGGRPDYRVAGDDGHCPTDADDRQAPLAGGGDQVVTRWWW